LNRAFGATKANFDTLGHAHCLFGFGLMGFAIGAGGLPRAARDRLVMPNIDGSLE
jgi:hypothetical protein